MDRFTWMAIRMMWPAIVLIVAGTMVASFLPEQAARTSLFASAVDLVRWMPILFAGGAAIWSFGIGFVLWQWHRGRMLVCECDGILGFEKNGRFGPYRTCLACRRNISRQHYATL